MTVDQNLQATLRSAYRAAYNAFAMMPRRMLSSMYTQAEIVTKTSEEYWLGDVPGVEEWINERTYEDLAKFNQTLTSKPWTTRGWRYNRVQNAGPNVMDLRNRMTRTIQQADREPDRFMTKLLERGETELAYDGLPFFSNASGTRNTDNLLPGAKAGTDPTDLELMRDLEKAFIAMSEFQTDTGNEAEIIPNLIVCSFKNFLKFRKVLESTGSLEHNQSSAVMNPFNDFMIDLAWSPYLQNKDDWYALSTNQGLFAMYWQTTTVDMQRIILDIDETKLASAGYVGVAASIWGNGTFGLPFAALKVKY